MSLSAFGSFPLASHLARASSQLDIQILKYKTLLSGHLFLHINSTLEMGFIFIAGPSMLLLANAITEQ